MGRENHSERIMQNVSSAVSMKTFLHAHRVHRRDFGEAHELPLYALHPELLRQAANLLPFQASSGVMGVILAMHVCLGPLDVYGMQMAKAQGYMYQYYSKRAKQARRRGAGGHWAGTGKRLIFVFGFGFARRDSAICTQDRRLRACHSVV